MPDGVVDFADVRAVDVFEETLGIRCDRRHANIRGDHEVASVALTKGGNELGSDLARRPGHEDFSHGWLLSCACSIRFRTIGRSAVRTSSRRLVQTDRIFSLQLVHLSHERAIEAATF
jgi:hypothetical protein